MSIQHSNDIRILRDRFETLEDRFAVLEQALEDLASRKKPGPKPKMPSFTLGSEDEDCA